MRLSTDGARDEARSFAVIEAALDGGVRHFDTAPSYALDEGELGHNEALLASCLRARGILDAVVVTKAGLTRRGKAWVPDGRRKSIEASAEASCTRLGRPLDVLLLHTVDPAVPLSTSVRALEGLRQRGIAKAIGLSNVSRAQLDEALTLAELSYLEVALSVFDDHALKSGVVARAKERGLTVLAHTPLGGPKRAARLARDPVLRALAEAHAASPAQIAIAYLVGLGVVPLVGATRTESARALGTVWVLSEDDARRIAERDLPPAMSGGSARDLVLLAGIQGAGKSTTTEALRSEGYAVMSRDARGGTLSGLAKELASTLAGWASDEDAPRGVVIDGTYGTRAQRAEIVAVAQRTGSPVRAIHLTTDPRVAQANVVQRIVRALGRLPTPEELRRSKDPRVVPPRALFQYARAFEPLEASEGFASIETRTFERRPTGALRGLSISATSISAAALERAGSFAADRVLVYGWAPRDEARRAELEERAASFGVPFEVMLCPHGEGPPVCWCRPPLPGLAAGWVALNDVDVARSTLVGAGPVDRAIARAVGLSYVE